MVVTLDLPEYFAVGGPLAAAVPGYSPRRQQVKMAQAVRESLEAGEHLAVEAGTGVGKSLAYLLPCALWALEKGQRVVVATFTKALQEQLVQKDLPVVQEVLASRGLPLAYALLMGSENYLCLQRLDRALRYADDLFRSGHSRDDLLRLVQWSTQATSGLRSRLPFSLESDTWEKIHRDPDVCLGRRCRFYDVCLYRKDLEQARKAHVVVVNHHLLLAGLPLPAFEALVIDEAQNLEKVASDFLGEELTDRQVKRLLDDLYSPASGRGLATRLAKAAQWIRPIQEAVNEATGAAHRFFEDVACRVGFLPRDARREIRARRITEPGLVQDTLSNPFLTLAQLLAEAMSGSASAEEESELRAHRDRCLQVVSRARNFLACDSREHAYWVEQEKTRRTLGISLHCVPLDLSEALRRQVFERGYPVILTSATLTVAGSFAPWRARIGLDAAAERLLDSPFDYETQALLYTDPSIPDPKAEPEAHEQILLDRCESLIRVVPGGVFVLCTSWRLLESAARRLGAHLGRPIFKQGALAPHELLEGFRQAGNGLLLGTDTFWQGVDVPGPALSCVILTRLPFASPGSPLEEAREEWMAARGLSVFTEYSLPQAVIRLRQGFGRLIRSGSDYGVVAILDPRVHTKAYGSWFLRSLPDCRWTGELAEVRAFFLRHFPGPAVRRRTRRRDGPRVPRARPL